MPKITYIEHGGTPHTVEVAIGMSVMEGAVRNDVPGIDAECGGACACATCHVYVDAAWRAATGEPGPGERDMIEFASAVGPGSRLSCQIKVSEQLEGLVVRLPLSQH
jgi:2Fe-2S ferredoxin